MADVIFTEEAFVNAVESSTRSAFTSYKTLIDMGFTNKDALEMVIEEARESAACFAGVGSCGTGGCKHA